MKYYQKATIETTSEEYKNYNVKLLNKNIIKILAGGNYVWENLKEDNSYYVPKELKIYIDIYMTLYAWRFKHRKLMWDFSKSLGVCKLELNNKMYYIQMTMPQLFVVMKFNEKSSWSAEELSNELNIPLPQLGDILNSFLRSGLMTRQDGDSEDITLKFSYDHTFSFPASDKISIVKYMKNDNNTDSDKISQLLNVIKKLKSCTKQDLFMSINDNLTNKLGTDQFENILKKCICYKYIQEINSGTRTEVRDKQHGCLSHQRMFCRDKKEHYLFLNRKGKD